MRRSIDLAPVLRAAILFLMVQGTQGASPLFGQQDASLQIEEDQLVRFAKAHLAITAAREDFYSELARTHDLQGQARLREILTEKLAEILEQQEMDSETFERLTAVISANAVERVRFEKVLEELNAGVGGEP